VDCGPGTDRPLGAVACERCVPGYATAGNGVSCQPCSPGQIASSAGSLFCSMCPAGSFTSSSASYTCTEAQAGFYAGAGATQEMPCAEGRYADTTGRADPQCSGACDDGYVCPSGSRSPTETSIAPACEATYYLSNASCFECPLGTTCARGSTLQNLPLLRGYFRLDNTSTDVRLCPDASGNTLNTSGCVGGAGNPCAESIAPYSVYCELCESDGVYYSAASESEPAACKPCAGNVGATFGLIFAALAVFALLAILARLASRKMPPNIRSRLVSFNSNFSLANKLKISLGFYQIATKVPTVYEVTLPDDVQGVLDSLSGIASFGMQGISTTSLECMGLGGYRLRLWFWLLFPLCLLLVVGIIVALMACVKKQRSSKAVVSAKKAGSDDDAHAGHLNIEGKADEEQTPSIRMQILPPVLQILFLVYPLVTKTAFDGFPCYQFQSGEGWLRADVQVECGTPEYAALNALSWIAIFIYPVGIFFFCLVLLFKASTAILAGKETGLTKAIKFLTKEYDATAFWWELMEMARKFVLVGVFVTFQPGSILQISVATIVCAAYLMVQLQAAPYKNQSDDYMAAACSFSLLMVFFCSILFKVDALSTDSGVQTMMTDDQKDDYIVSALLLSTILLLSVIGSIAFAAVLVAVQIAVEIKNNAKLRRIKYLANGKWVECKTLTDPQAFHLFLSHAWPAAQDRMRIVKARFLEVLPSCRTFLDVDDLKSGSGTAEVDKSECILVFCTSQYFEKKNSLKELYRAVVQRRPILAMLEPDVTQEGGLNQAAVEALISNPKLDKFKLRKKHKEWGDEGELLPAAFDHAPDEADVRAALFATPPVEWNRLPHFQDVTIRLIAQNGILDGKEGELYMQGEAAMGKVSLPPPLKDREFHLFCSEFNAGAKEMAEELKVAPVFQTEGKKASAPLTFTTDVSKLAACDHMLVLLDERTWTSGDTTAKLVEHIHEAMRLGVHLNCAHEFPAVVGPPRHECEFGLMFGDEWTPPHLTGGKTNLYKEIALALKGVEWRQPGLVAFAAKLAASAGEHKPITFEVPNSYEPKSGPNPWSMDERAELTPSSPGGAELVAKAMPPAPELLPPPRDNALAGDAVPADANEPTLKTLDA